MTVRSVGKFGGDGDSKDDPDLLKTAQADAAAKLSQEAMKVGDRQALSAMKAGFPKSEAGVPLSDIARSAEEGNPARTEVKQDGSVEEWFHDCVVTLWKDGTARYKHYSGSGFVVKPDETGGIRGHYWGPHPEDNCDIVTNRDGSGQVKYKDGTGFDFKPDGKGGMLFQHWGPDTIDHYKKYAKTDGSLLRVDFPDGGGIEQHTDANKTTTVDSWGPTLPDNFTITKWWDDTTRTQHLDGTGSVVIHNVITKQIHHWGPGSSDNWDLDEDKYRLRYKSTLQQIRAEIYRAINGDREHPEDGPP